MSDQSRFYYTLGAFLLGAYLTSVWKSRSRDVEPELRDLGQRLTQQRKDQSRFSKIDNLDTLKKNLSEISQSLEKATGTIKQGIEGCIGNTPLIRIKSLSDATGCEILAKAEVKRSSDVRFIGC